MGSNANRIVLVGGGVRSGKSAFALAYGRKLGARRAFVATATPLDDEMRARIVRHQGERGGDFTTIEAAIALPRTLAELTEVDVAVVDCLTLWLSNLLVGGGAPDAIAGQVDELAGVLAARRFHAIVVTNEVGMGVVPQTALGRAFRDIAGLAHQRLGRVADEIFVGAMGLGLRVVPGPVERAW